MCGIWSYISKNKKKEIHPIVSSFMTIESRGPETYSFHRVFDRTTAVYLGFHRLSIHGLSGSGNQPFIKDWKDYTIYSICNGEIYNYEQIISENSFNLQSHSDCEVLPFLYMKYKEDMIKHLDGEYAFVLLLIHNPTQTWEIFSARDPFGVRPLFYGSDEDGISFGSELKSIKDLVENVNVFPPGHFMKMNSCNPNDVTLSKFYFMNLLELNLEKEIIYDKIQSTFTESVKKRLSSERPLGCLLSGGLDSSIVSAITSKLVTHPLHTFTIGLEGATDIKYAEMVAKHIGSVHTTFITTIKEALDAIDTVIYTIESYDCTSIRASVWQYLLGKKIREHTDIKVLLTGEGSDELTSGYMYFHNAPNENESHLENIRLLKDIHRFDGLRVDRAMSCHGLEVRIPFLDPQFVELYLSLPKGLRLASQGIEKQLFRDSFRKSGLLPEEVLYRRKEAFSDGTSTQEKSWFQIIQEHIDGMIGDEEFQNHSYGPEVDTKEKYYYKKTFEKYFGTKSFSVIPYYWLPKWSGNITEPSARVLDIYSSK
jgi:asparagine synthase (glutamine-hydrolysing)